jgi:hypothetical protein
VDPCYSCTERLAVVRGVDGRAELNGEDLVRLSQARTAELRKACGRTRFDELLAADLAAGPLGGGPLPCR